MSSQVKTSHETNWTVCIDLRAGQQVKRGKTSLETNRCMGPRTGQQLTWSVIADHKVVVEPSGFVAGHAAANRSR